MRYSVARLSDEDLAAALSYLRTLPPVKRAVPAPEISALGRAMISLVDVGPNSAPAPKHVPPSDAPSVERGEYLAGSVVHCVGCHSRIDMSNFEPTGPRRVAAIR